MIAQAALYLPASDDIRAALLAVAGRPVAYRVVVSAIRAGARRVALPAVFRGTALETAVAASPTARGAVVWLDEQPLAHEPTLLLPATALTPASALGRLLQAGPPAVLAESCHDGALARSSAARSSSPSVSRVAPASSSSWATDVALAIGAVTAGRVISHARATCAGVAR